jgi:hypothetical protein
VICEALALRPLRGAPPADDTGNRVCVCKREDTDLRCLLFGVRLPGFPIENDATNLDRDTIIVIRGKAYDRDGGAYAD